MTTISDPIYSVSVVKHELVRNEYVEYQIKIMVALPYNITFHIRDRYSEMLSWYETVKANINVKFGLPNFPPKKMFGNLD